ncbi:MAG: alpha-hydroxy-acid oxidizing protein [Acidobacteria bacterium]|nr:alpha-hydroxy-acid oxidizing protein [Acidobacteriota bacterium]
MNGDHEPTGRANTRASRRQFFRMLAASPALALAYPALSPVWQREVDRELARTRATRAVCADCGQEFHLAPMEPMRSTAAQTADAQPLALDVHLTGQVVDSAAEAINVWDFEQVAHANVLPQHWAYIHMGVDDFETRRANREGFQRLALRARRLGPDVKLDTAVTLFGKRWASPLFLCPVAALEAYHTEGESGAARAARARGILQIQSHQSSQSYEAIAEARGEPHWFQLYANSDWGITKRTLDKVAAAGCPVLVWTIDLLGGSNRELSRRSQGREGYDRPLCQSCHNHQPAYERPMHRGVSGPPGPRVPFDWDYVKRLKDTSKMKVVLKGIVTREDAELAVQSGADGVFVSNHGGRAENSLRGAIDSLPEVVAGVKGRVPVMLDSGVRRGADIFKALALGADAVGIGRPYVWGLAAFGQPGVDKVIEMLLVEFAMVMRQTRTATLDQIGPQYLVPGAAPIMMRDNHQGFGL